MTVVAGGIQDPGAAFQFAQNNPELFRQFTRLITPIDRRNFDGAIEAREAREEQAAARNAFIQTHGQDVFNTLAVAQNESARRFQADRNSGLGALVRRALPAVVVGGMGAGIASGLGLFGAGGGGAAASAGASTPSAASFLPGGGAAFTPAALSSQFGPGAGVLLPGGAAAAAGGAAVPNFFETLLGQVTSDPLRAVTGGASLLSGLFGAREQGQMQDQSLALLGQSAQQFNSGQLTSPFGGVNITPGGVSLTSPFGGAVPGLSDIFGGSVGQAGALSGVDTAGITSLMQQLSGVGGRGGILSGMLGQTQQLGNRAALDSFAGGTGRAETHAARVLDLLNQQAAPQEQAALQSFQSGLRNTGRGAVTGAAGNEASIGGGRLAAAFAEGQSRAGLGRQLAALEQGRAQASLEEDLLRSSFGRFAQTASLAGDLGQSAASALRLPTGFAADQLGLGGTAAGIFGNLAGTAMSQFNPLFSLLGGRSNALLGQATGVAGIAPTASPLADAFGAFTGGIFSNLGFGRQGDNT